MMSISLRIIKVAPFLVLVYIGCSTPRKNTPVVKDVNLVEAIKIELNQDIDPSVADLKKLTSLVAIGKGITDLSGLEHATELERLVLGGNLVSDLSPLSSLTSLKSLRIWNNRIASIAPLEKLVGLEVLELGGNDIQYIEPLAMMKNLMALDISANNVKSFSVITTLTKLKWLGLEENQITEIDFLEDIQLERLWLSKNKISDISVLEDMTSLKWLKLEANYLESILPLRGLDQLSSLTLHNNSLEVSEVSENFSVIEDLMKQGVYITYLPQNINSLFQKEIPKR